MEKQYKIKGMSCSSCSMAIEKTALKVPGIKNAQVSFATETGVFEIQPLQKTEEVLEQLSGSISKIGYELVPIMPGHSLLEHTTTESAIWKLVLTGLLSFLIFLFEMGPFMHWPSHIMNYSIQFLLCLPILLLSGTRFLKGLRSLFYGHPNMDTLIGLGIFVSLAGSFITLGFGLSGGDLAHYGFEERVYFEGVAFIIFFISLGHYIESKAKHSALGTLEALARLASREARLLTAEGEKKVSVTELKMGDTVRVLPGEKIPADGTVIKGATSIDESLMTGEPLLVSKFESDKVLAGTINGEGLIEIEIKATGQDTYLSQIIHSVVQAQRQRPKLQRVADKISRWFVPAIILLSVLVFIVWMVFGPEPRVGNSLSMVISVLVIACPCALGLAIPMVVSVASAEASQKGMLVKGGEVFEKAKKITTVAFDKTGTLTVGKPVVTNLAYLRPTPQEELRILDLNILKTLSELNDHPLSKAIAAHLNGLDVPSRDVDLLSYENYPGKGVMAKIGNENFFLGSLKFLQENKLSPLVPETVASKVFLAGESAGPLYLLEIQDELRSEAELVLKKLKGMGLKTILLSGDRQEVVDQAVKALNIDKGIGQLLPEDKLKFMALLQAEGELVAFVGDGINDAPALQLANLSFAMGSGSDVARAAADVVLLKGGLDKVLDFFSLSERTLRMMKQNLFWAFAYNVFCIPIAAGVLYPAYGLKFPPVLASMAMAMSSLSVVFNALRLKSKPGREG